MGPWTVLYFLCIVLFGRFYLINLVLAVVAASYENEVQNSKQVRLFNSKHRVTLEFTVGRNNVGGTHTCKGDQMLIGDFLDV